MIDWLKSLAPDGVKSKRLISVVFGVVLLVWLASFLTAWPVPELPLSVLALLVITVGSSALS